MGKSSTVMLALALGATIGCAGRTVRTPATKTAEPAPMAQLWVDPGPQPRDMVYGIGGQALAPDPEATYKLLAKDEIGFSVSYDVEGPDGTEWSAKIGPEAQTETLVSHLLWGLGYHQPPVYYLPKWKLQKDDGEVETISEARFRPKIPALKRGDLWRWHDNPFVGTPQHNGLLAILLILNGSDLKETNNTMYEAKDGMDGATRWYVVRDVGAALGETGKLYPRRNWLEGFEREGFIEKVEGDHITFAYKGRHQELLDALTPADVRWGAERLSTITDQQWRDLFRSTNYADSIAERFIRRIKEKVADGLKLTGTASASKVS